MKLSSSQCRGSSLMNGFKHHGLKAGGQGLEAFLCSDRTTRCLHEEGSIIGGSRMSKEVPKLHHDGRLVVSLQGGFLAGDAKCGGRGL